VVKPTYLRPVPRDATDASEVARPDSLVGLVSRCQGGDEAAWAELYRRESPRVARFLRRFLGPDRETDDAIQQVFVELFTSLPRFRGDAQPTTWIFRVAANVALNRLRTERRRERRAAALLDWLLGTPTSAVGPRPDAEVEARQELRLLAAAVDALPTGQRLVWVLREVEELSTEEVAAALDLEPGTVRSRLHHAKRKVGKRLERDRKRVR